MNQRILTFILFISFAGSFTHAQSGWVFDDSVLPEIHIDLDPADFDQILSDVYSYEEYPATFTMIKGNETETVENVGFRLRGNTSRVSAKKSFKVSFNTFVPGREYRGLDKLNINGEHNDPSIIRSKLSWDIFDAAGVAAPRANHVKLYVNDEYRGLYINVEHIDNEFVQRHFGNNEGDLFKCLWPADLTYRGGDPNEYKFEHDGRRVYDLTINEETDNYSNLAALIGFLEFSSDEEFEKEIENYINVDGVLRWMAVDMLTGMWDNYMFNKNNYYLYHNLSKNRFEFIPYDYDNTFGIYWSAIYPTELDWGTRDINNWGHPDESRPLTDRILNVPEYKNRLHFYINEFIESTFTDQVLYPEIDRLKAMIQDAAEEDTFRTLDYGYTINQFNDSYTSAIGDHVKYGLKGYISSRKWSALNQVSFQNITPVIHWAEAYSVLDNNEDMVIVTADVFDDDQVTVIATYNNPSSNSIELKDDGLGLDEKAGDGTFTGMILLDSFEGDVDIFIEATDQEDKTQRFPTDPDRVITENVRKSSSPLFINELMASNSSTIQDESGSYPDWLEIYNSGDTQVNMSGYYLTDDLSEKDKWAFPDTTIPPKGFLLVWVDNDEEEGPMHASFNLRKAGEDAGLFKNEGGSLVTVDAFTFGEQTTDVSYGRQPDGGGTFVTFAKPTPGTSNGGVVSNETDLDIPLEPSLSQNYPNPFNPVTIIPFSLTEASNVSIELFTINGQKVTDIVNAPYSAGQHTVRFDASELSSGIYLYRLTTNGFTSTKKLLLIK